MKHLKAFNILPISLLLALSICVVSTQAFSFENVKFIKEINTTLKQPVDVTVSPSGDIYILDEKASKVFIFDSDDNFKLNFGERGSRPEQLSNPKSIVISPDEEIIVADTGNHRIQVFDTDGEFLFMFGKSRSKPGQLRYPSGLAIDQFGQIYVADKGNTRIQIFNHQDIFLKAFATESNPYDLVIDPKVNLYILMPYAKKIVKYASSGEKLNEITCISKKDNCISKAEGIAVDMHGDVYISESSKHSIKKLDDSDRILLAFGSKGGERGQFTKPKGITVTPSDKVIVADSGNSRIQVLAVTGIDKEVMASRQDYPPAIEFDSFMPAEKSFDKPMAISVAKKEYESLGIGITLKNALKISKVLKGSPAIRAGLKGREIITKINGTSTWNMDLVGIASKLKETPENGITVLTVIRNGKTKEEDVKIHRANTALLDGKIFVADTGNNRVQVLISDGTASFYFGEGKKSFFGSGGKTGQLNRPQGIAVNKKGVIYVADTQNHRIQFFNSDGIFLNTFGEPNREEPNREGKKANKKGSFRYPKSIVINSQNEVFVLDHGNNRIQVFDEQGIYLGEVGGKGSEEGQFDNVTDIAIDENDYLYVADSGNHRIQIFDHQGKFIMLFGSLDKRSDLFQGLFKSKEDNSKTAVTMNPGYFQEISAITVSEGKVFVADYKTDQLQVFSFHPNGF